MESSASMDSPGRLMTTGSSRNAPVLASPPVRRAALILILCLVAPAGRAQVPAPSMVDGDLPPEEPRPAAPAPRPAEAAPATVPPAAAPAREPVQLRAIEPVRSTWDGVLEAWRERRRAIREQDLPAARAAAARLLDARKDLAIDDMPDFAASEIRDAERARAARLPADAAEHAELATRLAPDLADSWLELARVRFESDPSKVGDVVAPLWAAVRAGAREPHTSRAFLADVLAAALAALAATATAVLVLLFLRRARVLFHDFTHLPVVRSLVPLQAFFLLLVLLGLPLALGLGPWAFLAGATLLAWFHLPWRERLLATVALAALALLPLATGAAARATAWTGSLAEEVFELEHGADGGERAARLEARADLPAPALAAIGRFHKRRGDLAAASRWYDRAGEAGAPAAELLVNVGNVAFLQGDVEHAKAAWLDAADRATDPVTLAAASYNLSKLYLRQSQLEQSQQARRRAEHLAPGFIARHGSDDDFRANRWIVDVPVGEAAIERLVAGDPTPALAREAVRARLAGRVPPRLWPWAPLGFLLLLWAAALLARGARRTVACDRCGRPACPRCEAQAGPLCGQCVHVFQRKGLVEPRDRERKEAQVRRHEAAARWTERVLALLSGGGGHVWRGQAVRGALVLLGLAFLGFVLLFWRGLVPPPHPSPFLLAGKLAVALPLGLALYGLAVRDAWRRPRD